MSASPAHQPEAEGLARASMVSSSTGNASSLLSHAKRASTASTSAPDPSSSRASKVVLETLLVGGERRRWTFELDDDVAAVRRRIWTEWPADWPQPRPDSEANLRILHLGHILDDATLSLASRGIKPGTVTVVHVIVRATLPADASGSRPDDTLRKKRRKAAQPSQRPGGTADGDGVRPGCTCVIC